MLSLCIRTLFLNTSLFSLCFSLLFIQNYHGIKSQVLIGTGIHHRSSSEFFTGSFLKNGMPASNPGLNQGMQWNGADIGSMVSPAVFVAQNGGGSHMFYNGGMQQHNLSTGTSYSHQNGYYPQHQQLASNYKGNVSQYNGNGFFLQQPVVQQQQKQNGGNKYYSSQGGVSQLPDISNQGFGGSIVRQVCDKLGHDHSAYKWHYRNFQSQNIASSSYIESPQYPAQNLMEGNEMTQPNNVGSFSRSPMSHHNLVQSQNSGTFRGNFNSNAAVNKFDQVMGDYKIRDDRKAQASVPVVDIRVSTPRACSSPATSNPSEATTVQTSSVPRSSSTPELQLLDEFDPCDSVSGGPFGSVLAAPPNSNNAAMDLLGSLLLAIVPSTSTTTTFEVDGLVNSAPVTTGMATSPDSTMLNCRHASCPLKLCQSLPLIPLG
ncbi:hypothetical protein RchiOBHm_Chr5g0032581 [Rosa chinensis]|uniref:Uncharacterized protein n=1 Tax=Rosa chinensis TaxID=74649 RepID=A0A2P6QAG7_ROSCH|nr:hypothetical protein RchiOBHm_Chr5g0032581 [Rosa chinensis]